MSEIAQAVETGVKDVAEHAGGRFGQIAKDFYEDTGKRMITAAENTAKTDLEGKQAFEAVLKDGEQAAAKDAEQVAVKDAEQAAVKDGEQAAAKDGETAAEQAHNSTPTDELPGCGDPVDVAAGRVFLTQTDVELRAAFPLLISRTHLSTYRSGRSFGQCWASTLDQRIEVTSTEISFVAGDGARLRYSVPDGAEPVLPEHGPRWPLRRTDTGGFTITVADQAQTLLFPAGHETLGAIVHNVGGRIDIERDGAGTPTAVTHSAGYRVEVDTQDGLITGLRLRRPAANGGTPDDLVLIRYRYDADRRLVEVVNSSGQPLRFDYDADGRITAWQDRNGMGYRYRYDSAGRCVHTEGDGGYLTYDYTYDREQRITTATNSLGNTTTYHFNEVLQVSREIDPLGGERRFTWDRHHRLLAETDPLGHVTGYDYDEAGDLRAVTRPDGTRELIEYDDAHRPVATVAPDGAVSRREYGSRGELVATTDPAGARTRYGYDADGNPVSITDPLGNTTSLVCDRRGLVRTVTEPNGARTAYEYDDLGRITSVTDPTGRATRFGWTIEGLPSSRTHPDGSTQVWRYDGEGNLREERDVLGQATTTEIAHFDLPVARVNPDGTRQEYGYDTELRLTWVRNEQGAMWRYHYDAGGHLVEETDFDGRVLRYAYDAAGRLVRRTNGAGETIEFVRDQLGRVVEQRVGEAITRLGYDPAGRMLTASNADADLRYTYDPRGLVLTETCNGRTVRSTYDAAGRRIARSLPSGARSGWRYDPAGQPVGVEVGPHALALRKDAAGRDLGRQWGAATIGHDWSPGGRLVGQTVSSAAGVNQQRAYAYRPDGLVTEVRDALAGSRAFELDPRGRITAVSGTAGGAAWTEHYDYDHTGNLVDARWPGNDPVAGPRRYAGTLLVTAGATSYVHDAQGRVVRRTGPGPDGRPVSWEFGWTAEDRLAWVTTPDGQRWHYRYDPMGRRIAKQRVAPDGAVLEQVDFTWDGTNLAEEHHRTPTGQRLLRSWELEPGTDLPLLQREQRIGPDSHQSEVDGRFYAIVTDLVGTPTDLVGLDGTVTPLPWHTVWGRAAGGPAPTPLRFPGQYFDAETGLHYNYHRYFDPAVGRYTSPDPVGLSGGPNPSAYVRNPLAWLDPLGLTPPCESGTAGSGNTGSGDGGSGGGRSGRRRRQPPYVDNPLSTEPVAEIPTSPTNPNGRLYHYTVADGEEGIVNSGEVWPSEWSPGARANAHARYGSGGYFTDIAPGSMSQEELSQALVLNPNTGHRFTNYIEVDPQKLQESGYSIAQSTDRPNVFVVHHGDEPLNQGGPSNIDIGSNDALTGHGQNPPYNPPSSGSGDDS